MALGFVLLGLAPLLRAEDAPDNQPLTPYETALLDHKTGHYDEARAAIDEAEKAKPGDPATEILKARIRTELGRFAGAKKALEGLNGNPGLSPSRNPRRAGARLRDMCLRKRSFDEAAKFYESLLSENRAIPISFFEGRLHPRRRFRSFGAAKYASQLKPLDPDRPCYYFAKAALARATGKTQEAEDDIQTARTIYGITVANRYFKTYSKFSPRPKRARPRTSPRRPGSKIHRGSLRLAHQDPSC